jgi:hypothetical protein
LKQFQKHQGRLPSVQHVGKRSEIRIEPMSQTTNSQTEILHSEKQSKLSDEEVAKAVARHNKHHPAAKAESAAAAAKKATKS